MGTKITGKGTVETIDSPAQVAELEVAKEQMAEADNIRAASADKVFGLLKTDAKILVEMRDIEVAGETVRHAIRVLPYNECSRIDAKRYRKKPDGQLEFSNDYAETVGLGWQIYECIMVNANEGKTGSDGQKLPPDWKRMFTMEEILGDANNPGLMGNPLPQAKAYIYDLGKAIWDVNIELNPVFTQSAMESLGMK